MEFYPKYYSNEYTLFNAKALVFGKSVLEFCSKNIKLIKASFGLLIKILVLLILLIFTLPLYYIFGIFILVLRLTYKDRMASKDKYEFKDIDDYLRLKQSINKFELLLPKLSALTLEKVKSKPWFLQFTLNQMYKLSKTLIEYHIWNKSKFSILNSSIHQSSILEFKSEEKLWNSRNQAYKYIM